MAVILRMRGLPFNVQQEDVRKYFHPIEVQELYICRRNGRATGEGYVVLPPPADSTTDPHTCLAKLDKKYIGNRYIELLAATAAEVDTMMRTHEDRSLQGYVVRLRGLPYTATHEDVRQFMSGVQLSAAADCIVFAHGPNSRPTGEAYIELADEQALILAMTRHKEVLGDRYIEVFHSSKMDKLQAKMKLAGVYSPLVDHCAGTSSFSTSSHSSNSSSSSAVGHVYTSVLQQQQQQHQQQQQQQQGYFLPQHLPQQPYQQVHMQPYTSNAAVAARTGQLPQCSLSADMARMAVSIPDAQSAAQSVVLQGHRTGPQQQQGFRATAHHSTPGFQAYSTGPHSSSPVRTQHRAPGASSSPVTLRHMPVTTAAFRPQGAQLPAQQFYVPQQQQQQQQVQQQQPLLLPPGALVSQQVGAFSVSPAHTASYQCSSPYGLAPAGMQVAYCLPMPALQGMLRQHIGVQDGAAVGGFLQPHGQHTQLQQNMQPQQLAHSPPLQQQQQQQVPCSYMLMPHQLAVAQSAVMTYQGDGLQQMSLAPATAAVTLPAVNMSGTAVQQPQQQVLLHAYTQLPTAASAAPVLHTLTQTTTGLTLQQGGSFYPC